MEESTSKEKILKKIREALLDRTDPPFPLLEQDGRVLADAEEPLDVTFAEALVKTGGKFIYCESPDEFIATLHSFIIEKNWGLLYCLDPQLQQMLREGGIPFGSDPAAWLSMKVGILRCEYLVARTGSVVTSSRITPGQYLSSLPQKRIFVATTSQLMPGLKEALVAMKSKYGNQLPRHVTVTGGPGSGAVSDHDDRLNPEIPGELYLFLIEDGTAKD